MRIVDEYLAARVVVGSWPDGLPDDDVGLTASRHWRLLQRIHKPAGGQLSTILDGLSDGARMAMRYPHPEVLQVLDPRPLLDDAAALNASFNTGGLLVCESLAAALVHGRELWFGSERNVGERLSETAKTLGIAVHVLD